MSRSTTTNLALGVWDQGDNPGAGSKTVLTGNSGLNFNWLQVDVTAGVGHNIDGTHKTDVIDGPNLKTTAADGSSLELSGSPLKLRIRQHATIDANRGIVTDMIKDAQITGLKIAVGAINNVSHFATGIIPTAAIANFNVTTPKLADDAVDGTKQPHDSNVRRQYIHGSIKTTTSFLRLSDLPTTGLMGVPMTRTGALTGMRVVDSTGTTLSSSKVYVATGAAVDGRFGAGDKITAIRSTSTGSINAQVNGTSVTGLLISGGSAVEDYYVTVEYELDD